MKHSDQPRESHCAIGIDVGGTKCAAGLVSVPDGNILYRRLELTRPERAGDAVLADVIELARAIQREALKIGVRPSGIGLGVAELVGGDGAVLSEATIGWRNLRVGDTLHAAIQLPVKVDADVRAAARGEAWLGAGRSFRSFLYITIGTGISASLVVDKSPYAGARGLTGTFASSRGLIPSDNGELVTGPPLEQFAAGPAMAARLRAVKSGFASTAVEVVKLAEEGKQNARNVVVTAGMAVGAAIGQLVNLLDPEAVVIGGGLGMAGGLYRKSLESALRDHVWSEIHRELPIVSAALGNDAGFVGAALGACQCELMATHDHD